MQIFSHDSKGIFTTTQKTFRGLRQMSSHDSRAPMHTQQDSHRQSHAAGQPQAKPRSSSSSERHGAWLEDSGTGGGCALAAERAKSVAPAASCEQGGAEARALARGVSASRSWVGSSSSLHSRLHRRHRHVRAGRHGGTCGCEECRRFEVVALIFFVVRLASASSA